MTMVVEEESAADRICVNNKKSTLMVRADFALCGVVVL